MTLHLPLSGGIGHLKPLNDGNALWEDSVGGDVAFWEDSASGGTELWEDLNANTFNSTTSYALMFTVGNTINSVINHGTGSLANSAFTITLWLDGQAATPTVSVNETGTSGYYNVSFTPTVVGLYFLEVYETAAPEVKYTGSFKVEAEDTDTANISYIRATIAQLEHLMRRFNGTR